MNKQAPCQLVDQMVTMTQPRLIGEIMVRAGLITSIQLEHALDLQASGPEHIIFGDLLVDMGLATRRQITIALAEAMRVPFLDVTPDLVESKAFGCIDRQHLEEYNLLPLSIDDGLLTVAVQFFSDAYLIDDIRRWSGLDVVVVAGEPDAIRETRQALLEAEGRDRWNAPVGTTDELDRVIEQLQVDGVDLVEHTEADEIDEDLAGAEGTSPVIKLVRCIIQDAVNAGASDIHIEPVNNGCRVRCRVDGDLREQVRFSSRLLAPVVSRLKILAGLDISERRLPQDGGISVSVGKSPVELRVSTMPSKFGEKTVMRVVDHSRAAPGLDQIGMAPQTLSQFRKLITEAHGIVIITGPTGSGKTTTLYGALGEMVNIKHNISTIEDPVERRLDGTNQFQVNNNAEFTFTRALRSLLRQDPDVLMVGEVRDTETARLATEAALTGHLVLTTLHTNDALAAIPRLVNMGVEPYLVAASLRGVLAQRLVKRLCPSCKQAQPIPEDTRQILAGLCGGVCPIETIYTAEGCRECNQTGSRGRVGVFELVTLSESVLGEAICAAQPTRLHDHPSLQNRRTLLHDGLEKVQDGLIDVQGLLNIVSRVEEPGANPPVDKQAHDH